jgi:DNA-nicking Smr family endonuclease
MQEIARKEALDAARSMVEAKRHILSMFISSSQLTPISYRLSSNDQFTVDLHGTTVSEAIAVVRDILRSISPPPSSAKPLKIITGKGTHSTGRVGVLRPAVKTALVNDGWNVGVWEAGLIIRGKV